MPTSKDYDKALYRYTDILSKISLDERPTNKLLAVEYNVKERTIQRDMKKLNENFPLKKDTNGGWFFDHGFSLRGSTYSVDESIALINSLMQIQKAGTLFDTTLHVLFKKFIFPIDKSPYYIKPPLYEYIDMDSPLMDQLEEAIYYNNTCNIFIKNKCFKLNPYKIINHHGIWYLLCEDIHLEKLMHYVIAKIDKIEVLNEKFVSRQDIEDLIQYIHSPYYVEHKQFEVIVEVSSGISDYFLVKNQLPSQKIIETKDNGNLVLSYMVSHEEEIDNLIKAWLPDIKIIQPEEIKIRIFKELKQYLEA